jgi:hypothetical protein
MDTVRELHKVAKRPGILQRSISLRFIDPLFSMYAKRVFKAVEKMF